MIKKILIAAGLIEIAVGLLHFAMPFYAYNSKGFSLLLPNELDFVTTAIFSIGILLTVFGSVTILLAWKMASILMIAYYYVVIKTILWAGRVVLELWYPIQLSLFHVEPFTLIVLPGLIIELLLFMGAAFLIKNVMMARV
jgi:hypothetical protein